MYYPSVTRDNNTLQDTLLNTDVLQVANATVVSRLMPKDIPIIIMRACVYVISCGEE